MVVMDGDGITGDSIGITGTRYTTMAGITRAATRFITGAMFTGKEAREAVSTATAAELAAAPTRGMAVDSTVVELTTGLTIVLAQAPGLSTETSKRREDTLNPAVRAESARAPSVATIMADRPKAFRHAEAPAWVAERALVEEVAAAVAPTVVAGITDRGFIMFVSLGVRNGEKANAACEAQPQRNSLVQSF
jgi:hypothetical protein